MANPRTELLKLLNSLGESSAFVASGSLPLVLPGLDVTGVGAIGLPVSASDAKRMIAQASQAPFGRGEQTVVDTKVRNVWQVDPSQFKLRNREWNDLVTWIGDAVKKELSVKGKLSAELYKLLVYEKGSFFAPHRDSEKAPGMFATLVVCLPSRHEGGQLIVRHDGEDKSIDFGGADSEFKTQYVAFFADCEHEITPIKSGYRVALVYNLSTSGKKQPSAPRAAEVVDKVAAALQAVFADEESDLGKLAIPFKHQYTQANFDPTKLKGSDVARLDVLERAAASIDFQCHVALIEHHQSGDADDESMEDTYGWGGSRRWSGYEDEDEEYEDDESESESKADFSEIIDEEITLNDWFDPRGKKQSFGEIGLDEEEILVPASADEQPNRKGWSVEEDVSGPTGNEGSPMERWYRQGAVVLWPASRYFVIVAQQGPDAAIPVLKKRIKDARTAEGRAECIAFARSILVHWNRVYGIDRKSLARPMLELLQRLDDEKLVRQFLTDVLPRDFDGLEGEILLEIVDRFGWNTLQPELLKFFEQQKPSHHDKSLDPIVMIAVGLCCEGPDPTPERCRVCFKIAEEMLRVVQRWDGQPVNTWSPRKETRTDTLIGLVGLFGHLESIELLEEFTTHVLSGNKHYDLHTVLVPAVPMLCALSGETPTVKPAFNRIHHHVLSELRAATAEPVTRPNDWKRDAKLSCQCADCTALARFLMDPTQGESRFSLREGRRRHLEHVIRQSQCDIACATDKRRSPHNLVCTKTEASFNRRQKQYVVDVKLLAKIKALEPAEPSMAVATSVKRRR